MAQRAEPLDTASCERAQGANRPLIAREPSGDLDPRVRGGWTGVGSESDALGIGCERGGPRADQPRQLDAQFTQCA